MRAELNSGASSLLGAAAGRSGKRGFSLIELMVVLIFVAVLLVVAMPSYNVLTLRTKLKSYTNELVASIYLARSEAIKRSAPMTLCISADGIACAGGGDWDAGWIVLDPNGVVIKHRQAFTGNIKLFELTSVERLNFQPSGVSTTPATFKICGQTPEPGIEERRVTVSGTGRPRVETTETGCPGT